MASNRQPPPPTRYGPQPVQRHAAAVSRAPAPPPTRFGPASVQRSVPAQQHGRARRAPIAVPPGQTMATIQRWSRFTAWVAGLCGGGGDDGGGAVAVTTPLITTPIVVQPRRFMVDQGQDTPALDATAGPLEFSFGYISICTAVYVRQVDYCAAAHVFGNTYDASLVGKIIKAVADRDGFSGAPLSAKVYFAIMDDGPFLEQPEAGKISQFYYNLKTGAVKRRGRYFMYRSAHYTLLLDENGDPTSDRSRIHEIDPETR